MLHFSIKYYIIYTILLKNNQRKGSKQQMKKIKKIMSILLVFVIMIPYLANMAVSAEEAEKYPYMMFGRNGITMTAS